MLGSITALYFRGKEEVAELEAAFRRADLNGDGKVRKDCVG